MHSRRSSITTVVSILAAAGALAVGAGAASCAASGAGENQNFTDSGTLPDATTDTGGGGGDSSSNTDGPSCDADTMTNLFNCGSCGHKCGSGQTCSCGMCQDFCTGGKTACCGSCVDTTTDINNCGQCGNQCLPPAGGMGGIPHCVASTCTFTCPDAGPEGGTILTCGADAGMPGCYDPTSSTGACGGCGKACSGAQSCVDSMCCATGDGVCGGQCTAFQTDPNNCGGCDAGCGGGDAGQCVAGKCVGYAVSNPTVAFIDACSLPGHSVALVSQSFWNYTPAANLPFSFTYFGTAQTQFWIGSQGTLGFGAISALITPDGPSDCTTNWPPPGFPPPDPGQQYPEILAFGDANLSTGPNGVCYGVVGADAGTGGDAGDGGAGSQFVVTWSQASQLSDPSAVLTFSVVLTEGTNTIDLMYGTATGVDGGLDNVVAGASATVGAQALQITEYTKYSCMAAFIPSTPFDVRLTPH